MQHTVVLLLILVLAACAQNPVEQRAAQGEAAAQFELGMNDRANPDADHQARAAAWFAKAAAQGHADAQNNLGRMYELGQGGLPQDFAKAIELYRQAATGGCMSANYNLGAMYRSGRGVSQDYQSIQWFRTAGRLGDTDAWLALSQMYFNGEGVAVNYQESYLWAALAATTRKEEATRHRDRVAAMLTTEEVIAAQAAATAFQEKLNVQGQ